MSADSTCNGSPVVRRLAIPKQNIDPTPTGGRRATRNETTFISRSGSISNINTLPTHMANWLEFISAIMVCLGTALAVAQTTTSVKEWEQHTKGGRLTLLVLDFVITLFFILDYLLRVIVAVDRFKYMSSFFGLVDGIVAVACSVSFVAQSVGRPHGEFAVILRIVRLVRIFRLLKLMACVEEAHNIQRAIRHSVRALLVYLFFVAMGLVLVSIVLFAAEGGGEGFESMPHCIWWAVVTLTTVGYGDAVPQTTLGRLCAMAVMLLGYGLLAVPTIESSINAGREADDAAATRSPDVFLGGATNSGLSHCTPSGLRVDVLGHGPGMEPGAASFGTGLTELCAAQWSPSFDFSVRLTTSSVDNDQFGCPSCSSIQALVNTAVCAFLTQAAGWDLSAIDLPRPHVAQTSCKFLQKVRLLDPVEARVGLVDASQLTCTYCVALFGKGRETPSVMAHVVHAWIEPCSWLPCTVPQQLCNLYARSPSSNQSPVSTGGGTPSSPFNAGVVADAA